MSRTVIGAGAVFTDRVVLAATVLVLSVLGGAGWALFGVRGGTAQAGQRFTHMHCPACGHEVDYTPVKAGKTCESCGKYIYTPTSAPTQAWGGGKVTRVVLYLLFACLLLQGLAFLSVRRFRVLRKAAVEAGKRRLKCRCPSCKRKLGYPAARAGSAIVCSRCKKAFTLPRAG